VLVFKRGASMFLERSDLSTPATCLRGDGGRYASMRFKARTLPKDIPALGLKKNGQMISASKKNQGLLYALWLECQSKALGKPLVGEPPPCSQIGEPAAYTCALKPGDIVTIFTKEAPISGHIATVVSFSDPTIRMASGNAGTGVPHKGSIRVEEVKREVPKTKYAWQPESKTRFPDVNVAGVTGVEWVVGVQTASQLDPAVLSAYDAPFPRPARPRAILSESARVSLASNGSATP